MKIYKFHRYSKTCRKYRSEYCRFHLGKFFTNRTITAQPFSDSLSVDEKNEIMGSRKLLLKKVKQYIDTELNPSKKILTASQGMSMKKLRQLINSWKFLGISKFDHEQKLPNSDDSDFQIHNRKPINTCFVNDYFCDGLMIWETNMDIQPVFNH